MASTSGGGGAQHAGRKANKLLSERSPYLRQHCYNPVEWYPWGDEAFKQARELDRPIFLSVGYSTCHWCHVMEHESFENEQIAKLLNENFVSIKVDREERPDVDKLYMSYVQASTGGGGWPMSVFLTPDLEPLFGGTYFPPTDNYGRTGFATILEALADKWRNQKPGMVEQAHTLRAAITEALKQKQVSKEEPMPSANQAVNKLFKHLRSRFDASRGGFNGAPKFPKPVDLDFLLYYHHYAQHAKASGEEAKTALTMVETTLEKMDAGGIHDHVGGGFHRYSVDAKWHVPHFEKMLYDQAQLLGTYADFHRVKQQEERLGQEVVADIVNYLRENLLHPAGGFYCAEDADSLPSKEANKKKEGAFYAWKKSEVDEVLYNHPLRHNENLTLNELACSVFQVSEKGNVSPLSDPHGELTGLNILQMVDPPELEKIAAESHITLPQLMECVTDSKKFLAEYRAQRPRPHLDNKLLTSWNALAITGLAKAAAAMRVTDPAQSDSYLNLAQRAMEFAREHLTNGDELVRAAYVEDATGGKTDLAKMRGPLMAFADDYAFLIEALLALYEVNFDESLLEWAEDLQRQMDLLFWDSDSDSGYFLSRCDDSSIIARQQEDQDGAEPSTNSVAAGNLLRMHALLGRERYLQGAENIFRGAVERLEQFPYALPKMVVALHAHANKFPEIVVVGNRRNDVNEMLAAIQSAPLPFKMLAFVDMSRKDCLLVEENPTRYKPLVEAYEKEGSGKPTVYICRGATCQAPIHSMEELKKALKEL